MAFALIVAVSQPTAQAWISEYQALPRLYQMSRRPRRPSRLRVRFGRTLITLTGSLLWVAVIRYILHLG